MKGTFNSIEREFHLLSRVLSLPCLLLLKAERTFALLLLFSDLWLDDRDGDGERLLEGIGQRDGEDSTDSWCWRRRGICEVH